MTLTTRTILAFVLTAVASTSAGRAETTVPTLAASSEKALHIDVEVDPTAYVFSGYSVHAGVGWKQLRLDLGVYAMDLPAFLHGNEGWDASFDGIGAKLQWFPFAEQRGMFVDVSAGVSRRTATVIETGSAQRDTIGGLGIDAGYRISLPYNLYITPWAGVSYDLADTNVMLDGKAFTKSRVTPFAAVHVGYRFR